MNCMKMESRPFGEVPMKGALVFVVLTFAAVLTVVACGGNDKPPLVPDSPDMTSTGDGGAAPPTTTTAPTK